MKLKRYTKPRYKDRRSKSNQQEPDYAYLVTKKACLGNADVVRDAPVNIVGDVGYGEAV